MKAWQWVAFLGLEAGIGASIAAYAGTKPARGYTPPDPVVQTWTIRAGQGPSNIVDAPERMRRAAAEVARIEAEAEYWRREAGR